MWCPLILAYDVDLENDGFWQVTFVPRLCCFIFIIYPYYLDQYVVIAWVICSLYMTTIDFEIVSSTTFQVVDLV